MTRTICTLVCAAGLLAGGGATADQLESQPQNGANPVVIDNKPDPTLTPREISEREQEYLSALRKCEPLKEGERQTCINAVKDKYGLM